MNCVVDLVLQVEGGCIARHAFDQVQKDEHGVGGPAR